MNQPQIPLILSAQQLKTELSSTNKNILLIDIGAPTSYIQQHIDAAIFLDYSWIVRTDAARMGLLPSIKQLNTVFNAIGLTPETHVIAYDDEGGGRACRLLWTLEAIGHFNYSLLDGGIQNWVSQNYSTTDEVIYPSNHKSGINNNCQFNTEVIAEQAFIQENFNNPDFVILDSRSSAEYSGQKAFAERAGHIPGAVNWDWVEAMDINNNRCLKSQTDLNLSLEKSGIDKDKTIITHCHTHHRSAHTFIVLKSLGYQKIKGYPGSWSDWGNSATTPIEL